MAKKADQKTLDLIKEVSKRKAEIAKLDRPNYQTNLSFKVHEDSNSCVNLQVLNDVRKLLWTAAFLRSQKQAYDDMVTELGVEDAPTFLWQSFTIEEWLHDIKLRIDKVQISSKKQKLELLESRLNAIISPELRAELELEAIAKELNQ